jgi:hypothetical protein
MRETLNSWLARCRVDHWLAFAVMMLCVVASTPPASRGIAPAPSLGVTAPTQVDVGQPITLDLTARGVANLAGYEMAVLFDPTAAEFNGLRQRKNDLKKIGRDVGPLTAIELPAGVSIGLYSCPVVNCVNGKGAKQGKGGNGTVRLGTLLLTPTQPGTLEIQLSATKFVDAAGAPVAVAVPTQSIVVQVGPAAGPRHPAPAPMWTLPAVGGSAGPLDLTGDGKVTNADVMEVALAWRWSREQSAPCRPLADPSRDINRDGCIDVADAELVAASLGSTVAASQAAADAARLTFTVNAVGDAADANIGDGMCATSMNVCTLRAAIAEANTHAGPDTIAFDIPGNGVQTIQLTSSLPALSDATGPTTIDGYTQPGCTPNTSSAASNAALRVQIRGNGGSGFDGLIITAQGNMVRGLALFNLARAIYLTGSGATDNVIVGNFIGTDAAATFATGTTTLHAIGVVIDEGSSRNHVGGSAPADRNVISGNGRHGISTYYEATDHNVLSNNIIGLSPLGDRRLTNLVQGIDLNSQTAYTLIGGPTNGERNVISGNGGAAIEISHDTLTVNNQVIGNYIGTDLAGTGAKSAITYNGQWGVHIEDGASNNLVSGNIIGNSRLGGVKIEAYDTINNQVTGNRIGIGTDGNVIGNSQYGVLITIHASRSIIGPDNIIANNPEGIQIPNADNDFNTITRNSIYGNAGRGIDLQPLDATNPNVNDAGDGDSGANEQLNSPVLSSATPFEVRGTACAEAIVPKPCIVEVFAADRGAGAYGQGKTFLGSAQTGANGSFSVALSVQPNVGDFVTTTATDANGNTSEFGANREVVAGNPVPTPTPTSPPPSGSTVYAADTFSRQMTDSWGVAEVGGGYAVEAPSRPTVDYDVNGNAGIMNVPVSNVHSAYLTQVSAQDVDLKVRVKTDKVASGGFEFAYLVARRVSGGTQYLGRMAFDASGAVQLQAARSSFANNAENATLLGTQVTAGGVKQTANGYIWLRGQFVGTNPTTIKLKAWADGESEPSVWQYTVTDSEPALQGPGGVGLRAYLTSSAISPVLFSFDDFQATSVGTAPSPTATPTSTPTTVPPTNTPTPIPPSETVAADTFSRQVTDGWGSAESGGAYTLSGAAADFDVNGTGGTINNAAGAMRSAYLTAPSARDVDITFRVATNKSSTGGGQISYVALRFVGNNTTYLARLRFTPTGSVGVQAISEVSGADTLLATEKIITGLTQAANSYIWVRAQVVGASPTTLRIKAWADGQSEPASWQYSTTDSTASLQSVGGVGLRSFLAGSATNAPVLFTFDDFQVLNVAAP